MKFFSLIIKHKKIATFALLFLVFTGIVIPYIALADWNPVCWEWLWGKPTSGTFHGDYCYYSAENNQAVLDTVGDPAKTVFTGMILAVATIMVAIAGSLATLASNLFSAILGASSTMCYTCFDNPAIAAGWPMVRNLANMFIVLGFVVIGIATTLRIQEYQAKKLLPRLIIVALLINFSLLITGVFIDASNIVMTSFSKGGGFLATSAIGNISNQASAIWSNWDVNASTNAIGTAIGIVFYDIILFVVFMLFFFLFLFRYIALWILVILSPLAFVCWVFPFTKKFFEMWWSNFLGWCIVGIPAALFMWISDKIASDFISSSSGANPAGIAILGYLVPAMFLIAGFLFSIKTSAMGASTAIGIFKKTGKFAGAGATKLTSLATDKSGVTRAGQWAGSKMGGALETIGLRKQGTTEGNKKQRLEESSKRLEKAYTDNPEDNQKLAQIATQRAFGARATRDKAAATEILAKRNAFDYIPENQRETAAARAVAMGVSKETITKSQPHLVTGIDNKQASQKLINEEKARLEQTYAGTSATPEEKERLIKKHLAKYKPSDIAIENKKREMVKEKKQERKLDYIPATDIDAEKRAKEDYTPTSSEISGAKTELDAKKPLGAPPTTNDDAIEYLRRYYKPDTDTLIKTKEKLTTERAKEKTYDFKYANREETRQDLIDKEAKRLKETVGLSGAKLDIEIKKYSDKLTPANIETGLINLNNEREEKAISKLGVAKLRELPESQIDAKLVEHSNYGTLARASLEFTKELKDKYKTLMPELREKITSSLGLAITASNVDIKTAVAGLNASGVKADKELAEKVREIANKMKLVNNW